MVMQILCFQPIKLISLMQGMVEIDPSFLKENTNYFYLVISKLENTGGKHVLLSEERGSLNEIVVNVV